MSSLNVFKFGYMSWKYPRNWFNNIKQFFCNIKYAYQRATKGYCTYDIWDIDTFHTNLIIDALTQFKKDTNGYPFVLESNELDENGEEKWNAILDEMIAHFANYRDTDIIDNNEYADDYFKRIDNATETGINEKWLHFMRVNEDKLSNEDHAMREQYRNKMKELAEYRKNELELGMQLLTKWYDNLWW